MKSKEVLTQLIEYLETFEAENPHLESYELKDFVGFLEGRLYLNDATSAVHRDDGGSVRPKGFEFHKNQAVILSRLISLLYRYAKEYTKMALEDSKLQTVEEFSFLIVLMTYEKLSKTELIQKNVLSKTSGTEVIKRLLKKKLIQQFRTAQDKRVQQVSITNLGLTEMHKVFPKMKMASEIVTGDLAKSEQHQLIFLMQKLEVFHHQLFDTKKEVSLAELMGEMN